MTISPDARWKNADVELANARIELERTKVGRSKLSTLRGKHEAEYNVALQDWSRNKTDEALTRMRDARLVCPPKTGRDEVERQARPRQP